LRAAPTHPDRPHWTGDRFAIHADLGRAEWPQTPGHVEAICKKEGIELVVVRREKGDLVQRIEERLNTVSTIDSTRPAKPFWPSAQQRYCTSDLKRGPIHKALRRRLPADALIISALGMRADESHARAKRPALTLDRKLTGQALRDLPPDEALAHYPDAGCRLVLNWLPLHGLDEAQVWQALGSSIDELARRRRLYAAGQHDEALHAWPAHVAYVFGNTRLSCALCILGSRGDLVNGARHNPDLLQRYIEWEKQTGYTFRQDISLQKIARLAQQPIHPQLSLF